jgi:hypothetical protein
MSFLVPYDQALKPDEKAPPPAAFLPIEPDVPPGPYRLLELYCSNPDCPCLEAVLQVFPPASYHPIASIHVSLNPTDMPNPRLDSYDDPVPYAQALFMQITRDLNRNPAYLSLLRAHYDQVKAVAADPSHPAHSTMLQWASTGGGQLPPAIKRKKHHH